jgi:cell division transport system permease protein
MQASRKTRRRRPSGLPSVVSIGLVLFSLGLLGISVFAAREVSRYLKEEFLVEVFFADSAQDIDAEQFTAQLTKQPWALSATFIHKDKAAERLKNEIGEDFLQYYGTNFLPHKTDLHLRAEFTKPTEVARIAAEIRRNPLIEDVRYQPDMLDQITQNLRTAQWVMLAISAIMVLIAVSLISSSLRLSVFASRFLIKSMQLVGATEMFIIMPFIRKFAGYALWGWLMALALLAGSIAAAWYLTAFSTAVTLLQHAPQFALLAGILLVIGLILAVFSAWFGARKYLRMKIEQLY